MRAVVAQKERPVVVNIPAPSPQPNALLVRVKATALNRADLLQVKGQYPPPAGAPETLGLEFAGDVAAVGSDAEDFNVGDRVMALVAGGGYAEMAVAPAAHCMPIPDNLSYEDAAALPEAYLTAYSNMVEIGGLTAADTVLIHAGASGVGLACIQIAKVIGANIIATASGPKHEVCRAHGAGRVIDYRNENFADVIEGADLVIDFIGAAYWAGNVRVLNKWGRLVFIGLMGGRMAEVDFGEIMRKRLTISGSTMRDRGHERKAALIGRFWKWAMPHFVTGHLKPTVWRSLPLAQVEAAHHLMAENQNAGKIVLTL